MKVLVVDDHPVVLQGVSLLLDEMPGFVLGGTAADGRSAIRESHRLQPDIVLLDVRMGEDRPEEVVAGIRLAAPRSTIILFTADPHNPDICKALAAGSLGPVSKAIRPRKLQELLVHVVRTGGQLPTSQQPQADPGGRPALTSRELDVLRRVSLGWRNAEIADDLGLRVSTVKSYWQSAMSKLGARNRVEATSKAHAWGLLSG